MQYASTDSPAIVSLMGEAKSTTRVSVDLPNRDHERLFNRCKWKLGGLSMNKRIIQLVQADNAGLIDVPHEPKGR